MTETQRPLKVFLCHASIDKPVVRALYRRLVTDGVEAWLDEEKLLPGQNWQNEIPKAVTVSDVVIVCLSSKSINKEGYVQKEIRIALDIAEEKLDESIFIIPARLENCGIPARLNKYHWVDLFDVPRGYEKLIKSLTVRSKQIGTNLPLNQTPSWIAQTAVEENVFPNNLSRGEGRKSNSLTAPSNFKRFFGFGVLFLIVFAIIFSLFSLFPKTFTLAKTSTPINPQPDISLSQATSLSSLTSTDLPNITPTFSTIFTPTSTSTLEPTASATALVSISESESGEIIDSKGARMIFVPGGEFTMGMDDRDSDERPVHKTYIDSFYMDKYEVTIALYRQCVEDGVCQSPETNWASTNGHSSFFSKLEYDNYPVIYVSWSMANTFCQWRDARLPTEGEWEKAARGVDVRTYPWGEELSCEYGNYAGCAGDIQPVGSYEKGKSPYGVYDLAGNVWEWVSRYSDQFYNSNSYLEDAQQMVRGGAWNSSGDSLRTTNRFRLLARIVTDAIGFRCARNGNQ